MNGRDCNKCVYHTSGSCSKWDCNPTSIEDVRNKAIDDFMAAIETSEELMLSFSCRPVLQSMAEQLKVRKD